MLEQQCNSAASVFVHVYSDACKGQLCSIHTSHVVILYYNMGPPAPGYLCARACKLVPGHVGILASTLQPTLSHKAVFSTSAQPTPAPTLGFKVRQRCYYHASGDANHRDVTPVTCTSQSFKLCSQCKSLLHGFCNIHKELQQAAAARTRHYRAIITALIGCIVMFIGSKHGICNLKAC